MLTSELLLVWRHLLCAREPMSAADLDVKTSLGKDNIADVLGSLKLSGDVEQAECTQRIERWRVTARWADHRPIPVRAHALVAAGFARPPSLWALGARQALELIATPARPDGSWNRDRAACQQLAAEALGRNEYWVPAGPDRAGLPDGDAA
jgi:hypothetical protein